MAGPLFDNLQLGDKRDLHISLTEGEIECLDRIAADNKCSRSTVISVMLRHYRLKDLEIPDGADQARKKKS